MLHLFFFFFFFFLLFFFFVFKLIRPHAHAVEILCGQHLMMNVYDFLSCCSLKHTHEAECLIPSSIFLSFIPQSSEKSPLWHVARLLTPSIPPAPPPPPPPHPHPHHPPSLPPPPPAHEVHWQCTTHNEGSLHASMKFNLRCEWMTEKSCRLWFILMKLYFKTAPHGRACWAATEFLITYKLWVF